MASFTPVDPDDENSRKVAPSFSGKERNRLFFHQAGNFTDASLISGADFLEDGRCFAVLDFDQDGFLDLAVTSTMKPRLRILRNTLGDHPLISKNNYVKLMLVGSNGLAESSLQKSHLDASGAIVDVTIGDVTRRFQKNCGEGLSSQNSAWIHIGLGKAEAIDKLSVTWPSGETTEVENVRAGRRLVVKELEAQQP